MERRPPVGDEILGELLDSTIEAISLLAMTDCGEEWSFSDAQRPYCETTWGLAVKASASLKPRIFTWGEDSSIGDPFYLSIVEDLNLADNASLVVQDVSALLPWNSYISTKIAGFRIHTYDSNYQNPEVWRKVPWGVTLRAGHRELLIGALHHGDFMDYHLAADEVISIFDPSTIGACLKRRDNFRSEWLPTR